MKFFLPHLILALMLLGGCRPCDDAVVRDEISSDDIILATFITKNVGTNAPKFWAPGMDSVGVHFFPYPEIVFGEPDSVRMGALEFTSASAHYAINFKEGAPLDKLEAIRITYKLVNTEGQYIAADFQAENTVFSDGLGHCIYTDTTVKTYEMDTATVQSTICLDRGEPGGPALRTVMIHGGLAVIVITVDPMAQVKLTFESFEYLEKGSREWKFLKIPVESDCYNCQE